jgi:AcrR family transcriptional regulator
MNTRESIITESLRLINAQGLESTGVREIARELQISPGNLSYYFARKEDIIDHHLEKLKHEIEVLLRVYLEEEEDLFRFLELLKDCLLRQYDYRGLFHQDSNLNLDPLLERVQKSIALLGRMGQLQLSDEDTAFLVEVINFHLRFWLTGISLEPEGRDDLIQRYLMIFVKLLLLFASPNGRINLLRFKAGLLH